MKLIVEQSQRYAKMRAHTATHLLHTELSKIFKTTKQAGSLVDEDYLRFDFNADRLLNSEELHDIEKNINQLIYDAYPVDVSEMSLDQATALWAKAFFEDKYWTTVRVVHIKNEWWIMNNEHENISIELCGGTHVANTKDIWCFTITGQETVASGIKRITALVGPKVMIKIHEIQNILDLTVKKLWIKTSTQMLDKLDKTLKEYDDMKSTLERIETITIKNILTGKDFSSTQDLDKIFIIPTHINFKNILYHTKWLFEKENILLYTIEWNFLLLTKKWVSAKDISTKLWLKWWGNDTMVQGRDEKVLLLFT